MTEQYDEDTPADVEESDEIGEGDRVEWRKQNGQTQRGTVLGAEKMNGKIDGLVVVVDSPTGEPCPIVWGPLGIFSRLPE